MPPWISVLRFQSQACRHDGRWSGSALRCVPRNCGRLPKPPGGGMDCEGTTFGKKCKFRCGRGLKIVGSKVRTCNKDGQWTGEKSQCVGFSYGATVAFKSHWRDYLSEKAPEGQGRATATCKCENFKIKR